MKTAILFAGQGSQHTGMGKDLYERFPAFREVFDNANLPFDLKKMCFENPDDLLLQTQYTQPCLVAFATGVSRVLKDSGILCDYTAGLSLGEYSALAHAGVLSAEAAIELTAFRGKAMADAAKGISSGMTAILNLDEKDIQDCCNQASSAGIVSICNYNCPGQIVIGGEKKAVDQASTLAMEKGARRCIPLSVSGPFHTSLMHPAGEALKERFRTEPF
ncbi:MAG: ACP S-malonyltransferase, partial [Lachnospiraceae bacterium]|nr:ACP S-malonyltransferase [Lachnospiraceae bacterium]